MENPEPDLIYITGCKYPSLRLLNKYLNEIHIESCADHFLGNNCRIRNYKTAFS
jgi:hypothetical protein